MATMKHIPRLDVEWLDPEAVQIVRALQQRKFTSYLVGGCVRDLLLGKHPKDYDIATNARPQEVKRAVPYCFIIGKRFRLVLAKRGEHQFEIATFRRDPSVEEKSDENLEGDNLFGTPEEDARRRDFTINALFYDPLKKNLLDFAGGLEDLREGIVRMIGDPDVRLIEDPIRILRGIRLSQMIRFALDTDLQRAMKTHAQALTGTALPRRREEFLKFLRLEDPARPFIMAHDFGVIDYVLPTLGEILNDPKLHDSFLAHIRHLHLSEKAAPVDLFAGLVQAFIRTAIEPDPHVELSAREILENPRVLKLMRDELGMFKNEQVLVAKAFDLQNLLLKRKEFERRGERRRRAVVTHQAFNVAIEIAKRDFLLSPSDIKFWNESSEAAPAETSSAAQLRRRKRRRPRHKRAKAHGHGEDSSTDVKDDRAHTREESN
jgi:poly(A) polymerase